MTSERTSKRDPKISNRSVKFKRFKPLKATAAAFATLLALLIAASDAAFGEDKIPVSIAWQVPVSAAERFSLEVATDAGFAQVVLTTDVRGSGLVWQAPEEGVYHWRLLRAGAPSPSGLAARPPSGEASTFVSGSFIAIASNTVRQKPARISWDAEPGSDSYKLYVLEDGGATRTMIAKTNSYVVPAQGKNLMIEVVPYSGQRRTFRHYHFNPTLKLDRGVPPPPPPSPPAIAEEKPAAVETPPPPPPPPAPPEPLRRRKHRIHVFGFAGEEVLHLKKLEVDLKSREKVAGGGGGVWVNPAAGLVISAEGSYHEHHAEASDPEVFGEERFKLREARYAADVGVGWDLLWFLDAESHMLTLSIAGAQTQVPMLPTQLDVSAGDVPTFSKQQVSMIGGALAYGVFGNSLGLVIDGGSLAETSDGVTMTYGRLMLELYPGERFMIGIGGWSRATEVRKCHPEPDICLGEGKSITSSSEAAGYLSLGMALR